MNGKVSYVVLENRGALGIHMIRHPYATFALAQERASKEAAVNPGATFYVAEVQAKYSAEVLIRGQALAA